MTKLKLALFCNEDISEEYLKALLNSELYEIIGYSFKSRLSIIEKLGLVFNNHPDELIQNSEVVMIYTSGSEQFGIAKKAIKNLKHIYFEKPLLSNIDEIEILLSMQREADIKIQVSSTLRLNSQFINSNPAVSKPLFIETRYFSNIKTGAPVVLELMINDLDIILQYAKSEVRRIYANAVCVDNGTPDIVNTRIEFLNGCVASLTVNRIANEIVHQTNIYQKHQSLAIDFNQPNEEYTSLKPYSATTQKQADDAKRVETSLLTRNFISFYQSIQKNTIPPETLNDGYRAMKLAYQIIDKIEERGMEQ